jgi:hypothetical protein
VRTQLLVVATLVAATACSRGVAGPAPATTSPPPGDTRAPSAPPFVSGTGPVGPSDLNNIVPTGSPTR